MKITAAILAASALALGVTAQASGAPDDITILNYALTLEHLEDAFYRGVLERFDQAAFQKEGYPKWVYQRVQQLARHEASHVAFLAGALGDAATQPCQYAFPYNSVTEALGVSRILESVGVSAYLGAAKDITTDAYLTAAGSILTVEARHQAVIAEVNGGQGFPSPYDTPLGYSQVFSLAAPFITSCPPTNPALPVVRFPSLTIGKLRRKLQLNFECSLGDTPLYAHFLNGLSDKVVHINGDHTTILPDGLTGVVYIVVSTSQTEITDANTVAGPAYVQIPDAALIDHFQPSFVREKKAKKPHHKEEHKDMSGEPLEHHEHHY